MELYFFVLIFFSQLGLSENELRDFTYSYGLIPSVLMGIDQLPADLINFSCRNYFYINVYAWRMDAFNWKHALFVDFCRQY